MARMEPLGIHEVDDEIRHFCEDAERVALESPDHAVSASRRVRGSSQP